MGFLQLIPIATDGETFATDGGTLETDGGTLDRRVAASLAAVPVIVPVFVMTTLGKRFLDDFFRLFDAVEDTGVDVKDVEDWRIEVLDVETETGAETLVRDVRTPNEAPTEMTPMTTSGS
ncbi:unnamed protein product [Peronospora farinosa]|uniref:Uncharacterized protein n=1 Tax=Peronospora farinosa TaxID=134698 RepID=A0ABN8C999_9STRA|nr:unnamed protein product [Peronospora farinosa]CAH0490710.1 unnamed protein product [Peronospora farinosa]